MVTILKCNSNGGFTFTISMIKSYLFSVAMEALKRYKSKVTAFGAHSAATIIESKFSVSTNLRLMSRS